MLGSHEKNSCIGGLDIELGHPISVRSATRPPLLGSGVVRLIGTLACVLAFMATTGMAPARSTGGGIAGKCPKVTRRIVAANTHAEIFEAPKLGNFPEYLDVFGCAYGHQRSYDFGVVPVTGCLTTACGGVRRAVLAGTFAAYETFFTAEEERWYVVVRDLRNGRILRHLPTGTPLKHRANIAGVGPVVGLVVKADGSVAWIAEDFERSSPPTPTSEEAPYFDVYAADRSGTRLLAAGLDVSPSSLALAGSALYWTQGGKPVSTVLR